MARDKSYSETEEKIFQAALKEFAEYGKKGARMQAIAEKVGCNKALVHYYFRNKNRLFEEVSNYVFSDFFAAIDKAITDAPTFRETLEAFVETYIDYLKKYGVYPLLMYRGMEADDFRDRHKKVMDDIGRPPSVLLMEKIEEAIERGEIREVDPHHTFMSLMGSCMYLFVAHPVLSLSHERLQNSMDEVIEERKHHIVDIMYNGLKNRDN